jgi:mannan endo-1,4-beta-mannosidase
MEFVMKKRIGLLILFSVTIICSAQKTTFKPANLAMSPEARALLELHYRISGKYILTGQHNYPVTRDRNSRFAAKFLGETPVIWSSDFGFSKEGDKDSYLARPDIVSEAIRQHKKGSIITLCWHAVPPTANEPITFQPQGNVEPGKLASVQGRLLEEQYKDLLTP